MQCELGQSWVLFLPYSWAKMYKDSQVVHLMKVPYGQQQREKQQVIVHVLANSLPPDILAQLIQAFHNAHLLIPQGHYCTQGALHVLQRMACSIAADRELAQYSSKRLISVAWAGFDGANNTSLPASCHWCKGFTNIWPNPSPT